MSTKQVIAFWQSAQDDEELKQSLEAAQRIESRQEAAARIVRLAEIAGFRFTADDLEAVFRTAMQEEGASGKELSDRQLEHASGGANTAFSQGHFTFVVDGSATGYLKGTDGGSIESDLSTSPSSTSGDLSPFRNLKKA